MLNRILEPINLFILATLSQILGYAYALPGHIGDPTWSPHAQFHLVLSWLWVIGLDIVLVMIARRIVATGDKWGFNGLVFGFIMAQGGHFIAMLFVFDGRPSETWYHFALGINLLLGSFALWQIKQRHIKQTA